MRVVWNYLPAVFLSGDHRPISTDKKHIPQQVTNRRQWPRKQGCAEADLTETGGVPCSFHLEDLLKFQQSLLVPTSFCDGREYRRMPKSYDKHRTLVDRSRLCSLSIRYYETHTWLCASSSSVPLCISLLKPMRGILSIMTYNTLFSLILLPQVTCGLYQDQN